MTAQEKRWRLAPSFVSPSEQANIWRNKMASRHWSRKQLEFLHFSATQWVGKWDFFLFSGAGKTNCTIAQFLIELATKRQGEIYHFCVCSLLSSADEHVFSLGKASAWLKFTASGATSCFGPNRTPAVRVAHRGVLRDVNRNQPTRASKNMQNFLAG